MSEKAPKARLGHEHLMYQNAIDDYPDFLQDLNEAKNLRDIIDVIDRFTYVNTVDEHIFFEVGRSDDGEAIEVNNFLTDVETQLLREFENDPPTEAEEIDMKVKHLCLNQAVKRVLGIKI